MDSSERNMDLSLLLLLSNTITPNDGSMWYRRDNYMWLLNRVIKSSYTNANYFQWVIQKKHESWDNVIKRNGNHNYIVR